jgi:hypothetical protein
MKNTEELMKQLCPNYVGNGLYVNPNDDKSVVETKILNKFSKYFRETDFAKKFVSQEYFELNCADFSWEYYINFNLKTAFIVMREGFNDFYNNQPCINLYIYYHKDDLKPTHIKFDSKDFNDPKCYNKIISMLKSFRQHLK